MGLEAACTVRFGRRRSAGKALLETGELIFRGTFRLAIAFRDMRSVRARDGALEIVFPDGTAVFELGRAAETWAKRIQNPKGLLDKLGVKPDARVVVLGLEDPTFDRALRERCEKIATRRPARGAELIFLGASEKRALQKLAGLRASLAPAGAIWVVWPKGRPALREDDVRAAAIAAGLVDIKVVAFSATLSALKLVIPRAHR